MQNTSYEHSRPAEAGMWLGPEGMAGEGSPGGTDHKATQVTSPAAHFTSHSRKMNLWLKEILWLTDLLPICLVSLI